MKILVCNYEYPPQGGGGGVVMDQLIKALSVEHSNDVTALFGWDYRIASPPFIENVSMVPVKTFRKNLHQSGIIGLLFFLALAWIQIKFLFTRTHFDLVHFHFSVPTGILCLALPHGMPYVCSLHGIDVPGFIKNEARFFQMVSAFMNRRVIRGAEAVFVPSNALKEKLLQWEPNAKVLTIPHGINADAISPKKSYSQYCKHLVCVTRLTKCKGIDYLIKAISALILKYPDVSLDIYGEGADRLKLEKLIAELKLKRSVRICGSITQCELFNKIAQYDLFILPSISEAFGLVFLEAMAVGLPVIATDVGGPAEIVVPGETGLLCKPGDINDLAEKIEFCINNPDKMEYYGRNGRKRIEKKYLWNKLVDRYIDAFRNNCLSL